MKRLPREKQGETASVSLDWCRAQLRTLTTFRLLTLAEGGHFCLTSWEKVVLRKKKTTPFHAKPPPNMCCTIIVLSTNCPFGLMLTSLPLPLILPDRLGWDNSECYFLFAKQRWKKDLDLSEQATEKYQRRRKSIQFPQTFAARQQWRGDAAGPDNKFNASSWTSGQVRMEVYKKYCFQHISQHM